MVKTTLITRLTDAMPLAASMEDDQDFDLKEYKDQAKKICKQLSPSSDPRCSIATGPYLIHYLIEFNVVFLCICQGSYPKPLAFAYLEELQKEFHAAYGHEIDTIARPYQCVKFDTTIQRVKRQYQDPRAARNLDKLNEELSDVTRIMTQNIQDVLGRGEVIDQMRLTSEKIKESSKKYLKDTKRLNLLALYHKYGPPVAVLLFILFILYVRYYWF